MRWPFVGTTDVDPKDAMAVVKGASACIIYVGLQKLYNRDGHWTGRSLFMFKSIIYTNGSYLTHRKVLCSLPSNVAICAAACASLDVYVEWRYLKCSTYRYAVT